MSQFGQYIKKKVQGLKDGLFYCEYCGNLLAKGKIERGHIEFKCRKCNQINGFEVLS